jgi:hypothetical protein
MKTRPDVMRRLAAANPLPAGAPTDPATVERLLASIIAEVRPATEPRRRIRRRQVAVAVAIALLAVATPTLAFSGIVRKVFRDDGWAVLEEARLAVSAPVGAGVMAHVWTSPSRPGGTCHFVTYGPPDPEPPDQMGAGGCSDRPPPSDAPALVHVGGSGDVWIAGMAGERGATDSVPPIVDGWINPKLGATRVELRWNGGSAPLAFANDHFVGVSEALHNPPAALLPFHVVAYDAEGREVFRLKLPAASLDSD